MKLYLVRHAQSQGNAAELIDYNKPSGTDENHLSELGWKQAEALADELEGLSFDIAIVSPLIRTRETIEPFLRRHPISVVVEPLTIERDAGVFAGQKKAVLQEHFIRNSITNRVSFKPEDGESILEVYERAIKFLHMVRAKYAGKQVLLCGHVNFIRCLDIAIAEGDINQFYSHEEIKNKEIKQYELP